MKPKMIHQNSFVKHHLEQVQSRSQKDVFFIWMLMIFISVVAAHFVLNLTGGSPTGFVTAAQGATGNTTLLLGALMVVFVVILITGLIYVGVTQKDH